MRILPQDDTLGCVQVIQALITLKDAEVENEVIRLKVLPTCFDLFFR